MKATILTSLAFVSGLGLVSAQHANEPSKWEKSAAVGLTLTKGNSDTVTFTGNVLGTKKSKVDEWALGADFTYGENQGSKSAETAHAFVQYNRLFTERFYGY